MNEITTQQGPSAHATIEEGANQISVNQSLAVSLARAEVDQQIATARAMPRSIQRAVSSIMTLATLDDESAEECIYALPRDGKSIRGPSVRLAEIIASQWGNCRVGARVVHVDRFEKYVEAEGVFHDLETNTATTARVRRRISLKSGRVMSDDMIVVTGNAACAIAKRNAILGAVPKAVWRKAFNAVESVVAGDVQTLANRRAEALKFLARYGVKPEQLYERLEIAGEDDLTLDHLVTVRGMCAALKSGEAEVEEFFPAKKPAASDAQPKGASAMLDAIEKKNVPPHNPETGEITDPNPPAPASASASDAAALPDAATETQGPGSAPQPGPASEPAIVATAREKARQGMARLNLWRKTLSATDAAALDGIGAELFEVAKAADEAKFQSAPLREGRHHHIRTGRLPPAFQSAPLREGRLPSLALRRAICEVSIRAPA